MVMARAPNAGAVHPLDEEDCRGRLSVAIVIPETGEALLPTMPTMRLETVTNRNPKTMTRSAAARLAKAPTCAPGTGLKLKEAPHDRYEEERASIDDGVR